VFGARGAGTALSRATAILAAVFMATSLSLTYVAAHGRSPASVTQDSALDRLAAPVQSAPATPVEAAPSPAAPAQQPAQGTPPASK
jgi:preprotein translocase subunit SecG